MNGQITRKLRGLDRTIRQGAIRALNRALTSSASKMARELREDTGLKSEVVSKRVLQLKATQDFPQVSLNIAIKFGIALRQFSPKSKAVKVKHRTDGRVRTHYGVTVKIGRASRQLVPGAFLLDNKAGLIVVGRKQAFDNQGRYVNPRAARKPLAQLRSTVFTESAQRRKQEALRHMKSTFDKNVNHEIKFAISRKFKTD